MPQIVQHLVAGSPSSGGFGPAVAADEPQPELRWRARSSHEQDAAPHLRVVIARAADAVAMTKTGETIDARTTRTKDASELARELDHPTLGVHAVPPSSATRNLAAAIASCFDTLRPIRSEGMSFLRGHFTCTA